MLILLLLILAIIIVGIVLFVKSIIDQNYINYLNENSIALHNLRKLNKKYMFYPHINIDEFHSYDNEKFFDSISCQDYLIYELQFKKTKILEQIGKLDYNKAHYNEYRNEVEQIREFGKYININTSFNEKKLCDFEMRLFEKEIEKPDLELNLVVTLELTKINGARVASKRCIFRKNEIIKLINDINNRSGNFYNNRDIWDAICRVERGRVSNKMRFFIYQRDHYRCKCCGGKFNENCLEIDHIVPIAKGGKSTSDNLQTLCKNCNKAKGTKIIRY